MRARGPFERLIQAIRSHKATGNRNPSSKGPYEWLVSKDPPLAAAAIRLNSCIASNDLANASTICDQILAASPGHPLFEYLRLTIQDKERKARLEYVRRLCAELEKNPNLGWRVGRLKDAIDRYPGEAQLVQLFRNTTAKLNLINSMLIAAHDAESNGDHAGSLEHLYGIRECHPNMIGLHGEIQRLESILELRTGVQRRTRLLEDIFRLLNAREYERAFNQCSNALVEFPGNDEILTLQKSIEQKLECARYVEGLVHDGIAKLEDQQIDEAISAFRSARSLDPGNIQTPKLLGVALLAKAKLIGDDSHAASLLIEEARTLIPNHPFFDRSSPSLEEDFWNESDGKDSPTKPPEYNPVNENNPVRISISRLRTRLSSRLNSLWTAAPLRPPFVLVALALVTSITILVFSYNLLKRHQVLSAVAPPLAAAVQISTFPEGAEISIEGQTSAKSVLQTRLNPGHYSISARMAGYEPQILPLDIGSLPVTVKMTLKPLSLALHIVGDSSGRVWLDGESKGRISGGTVLSGITPGRHTLRVNSPDGEATATFDFHPGDPPSLVSLPKHRSPAVIFAGSFEEKSHIQCNCGPTDLKVENASHTLGSEGLELDLSEGQHKAELSAMGGKEFTIQGSRTPAATVAFYWEGQSSRPVASVDVLLQEANAMIYNRNYKAALIKVNQILSRNADDDRAQILQKRLQRLMAIDP